MLLLALMGPIQLSIPLIFYAKGAKTVPAVTLSLIAMLDIVLNPFWTYIGAGEEPEVSTLIGGGVILGAVVLSIIGGQLFAARPRTTLQSALSHPAQ
jgi:drug/metabolite transporter (DMT)-like permease